MRPCIGALLLAHSVVAFSLTSFFTSESQSNELSLHPLSPALTDPASARSKRQAYQVYVDGDSTVSVDKSGQAETGAWGQWSAEGECSRTCGGGVQVEKRQCSGDCTGPSQRYVSCNLEDCASGTDYRAEQCATHNDSPLDGNYHKWLPYKGKNKCELLCRPETGNFYYKWDERVVDGTPCDNKGEDICVDGVCLPVGCDGKLGSEKRVDKCGICEGDGSKCKTVDGSFDERNLSPGYHDIIKLPVGATAIKIEEARPSSNNLALKNSSDHYYLNGNFMIQVEKDVDVAGTIFEYDDSKPERLIARGPLKEEVTVSILQRKGNKVAAIRYEFSIPIDEEVEYMYKPGQWSACSVTCGKGLITRTPYCVETASGNRVDDTICDDNNATKPEYEKDCETVDCAAEWFTGDWESCSATCGDQGEQYRVVYCHQVFANGRRVTVDDGNCTLDRPDVRQTCNRFSCPEWQAGPWSACSEKCGDAHQYRSVTCRSEKEGEEQKLLPAEACDQDEEKKMETERPCNLGPCEGLTFFTAEWKLCEKCNDTEETREVTCKDTTGRIYPLEKCLTDNTTEVPIDTRSCATVQPCIYEWTASQWSKCSTECGHGHKTRRVVCAIHQLGGLEVVDEGHCQEEKPETRSNCTNEEKCTGTWYTGPWSECSETCDGGEQSRMAVCLNYDKKPEPEWCDEADKPAENQECNVDPCPTCETSEFGCCPDNSTFATGADNLGCSNCTMSEFGCCADNYTEATGENAFGCLEYEEPVLSELNAEEGSGTEESKDDEPETCQVTNGDGDQATVDCKTKVENLLDDSLMSNETETNGTIHCSKTEFGCCPDWFTPATGMNNEGCETFVQGACNETEYGCCPDEVTLARGPNLEACGEPSCAGSLYGCCKDRKTIAFGPHYAGCERSSFPCELSSFGCCPDGETAALGSDGKGCGENCLVTKFGCCPDGKTVAKDLNNGGCGCEFAQFGCCPDGKSSAKGAGYYGCPNTCAQSKHGCCPDGKTAARGDHKEGCPCQYTRYGCCPDGETSALGPKNDGCDDCRYAKYGCCSDGLTKALGPNDQGCPATTTPPFIVDGTVSPLKITQCSLPQDQGNVCQPGYKLVWYYAAEEGRCSQFWYGGCGGNENKYATKEMCEQICVDPPGKGRCYLPKVEGPEKCDQLEAKYYYDHNTRQCAAFWWRGCLGNANNFPSWEECSTFCKDIGPVEEPVEVPESVPQAEVFVPQPPQQPHEIHIAPAATQAPAPAPEAQPEQPNAEAPKRPTMEEICRSSQDAGPCQDYQDMYHYNAFSGSCEQFIYGGCGGNMNRFKTMEECQLRCGFLNQAQPQPQAQPQSPSVAQPQAHQIVPDANSQPVQQAVAQPVRHPDRSSKSREACHLNVDVGRCKGSFDSWYYEIATGECAEFKYSGCGGNANRFSNKDACEDLCLKKNDVQEDAETGANSVCDEIKETGPCHEYTTQWFYNKADGTCNRFHYGGCKGTGNRFSDERSCKATCANHQDVCSLPKVPGPCSGKQQVWFYNSGSQACEEFTYGGCLGNTNRFTSQEECQARCPRNAAPPASRQRDIPSLVFPPALTVPVDDQIGVVENIGSYDVERCGAPKDSGRCQAAVTMFYFDQIEQMCMKFFYGGCEGNGNRFESLAECQSVCQPMMHQALVMPALNVVSETEQFVIKELPREELLDVSMQESGHNLQHVDASDILVPIKSQQRWSSDLPRPVSNLPELCLLPAERGPCFDNQLRYSYNSETGSCQSFMYGGCDGNANHFTSEEACERACGAYRDTPVCALPAAVGDCEQRVPRWHYDRNSGQCGLFMWSGCAGNANSFSSREDCEALCREEESWTEIEDSCTLPRSSGPCSDAVSMWYHQNGECRPFTYGGCRGNTNRFISKESCEKKCVPKMENMIHLEVAVVCKLPFESGTCMEHQSKWYFDFATGQCHPFTYGGCGGNSNRFESRGECLAACGTVGDRMVETVQALVSVKPQGLLHPGHKFVLTCEANGQEPIVWFKNGKVLEFSSNVVEEDSFVRVIVNNATSEDSGSYACATGFDGILSDGLTVVVIDPKPVSVTCHDKGSEEVCAKVVANGMCAKRRYMKYCCASCGGGNK